MPELPDISAYLSALQERIVGQPLERVRLGSPFVLRTAAPPLSQADGHIVASGSVPRLARVVQKR